MNTLSHIIIKYSHLFVQGINTNDVRVFLESSPQYPNLLSVVQTLQYVNMNIQVGQCNWEYLKNLNSPFLLHMVFKSEETLIISRWDTKSSSLRVFNSKKNKWETKNKECFEGKWDGVVLYTNARTIRNSWTKDTMALLLLTVIVTVVTYLIMRQLDILFIYALPIIIGFIVSLCAYWRRNISEIGVMEKICRKSSIIDCDAVEDSIYGVWRGLSLNIIAFSFFISQLICVMISYLLEIRNILNTVYLLSEFVLIPVAIYSIYGQVKVKKICPLCMIILICVFLEALSIVWLPTHYVNMGMLFMLGIINVCTLCLLQIHEHKHLIQQEQLKTTIQLLKLKRKPEILTVESTKIGSVITPIWLGNDNSSINITTIISPSCKHCRKVIFELLLLIEKGVDFRWNTVLGKMHNQDSDKIRIWVQEYISNKDIFLHDLYLWSNGQIQNLQCTHNSVILDDKISKICSHFDKQIDRLSVSRFPLIILNERLLSHIYTATDLEYLINDMSEWK